MKKRFISLLLTLVMLVSLIPATAITAMAASGISEAGVKVIKQSVGFHKNAYQVSETVWKIGYGTPSVKGAVIDEKNADKLLRDELAKIDSNAAVAALTGGMVQKRHDAMIWLSYMEGSTAWTTNTAITAAIANADVESSVLANALATWNVSKFDAKTTPAVLNRRMAVANLFMYGIYNAGSTGSFGYTVLNSNKGSESLSVQVFDSKNPAKINLVPTWDGSHKFLGWYDGNTLVTGLGSSTIGKTLVAKWQTNDEVVKVNYSVPAAMIYEASKTAKNQFVQIYSSTGATTAIDVLYRDQNVTVVAEKMVGTQKWLQLATGGWVKLCDKLEDIPALVSNVKVTVLDDYVNVRENPSVNATKLGVIKKGEVRTIVMTSPDGRWGYCPEGWIFLAYTSYSGNYASADGSVSNLGGSRTGTISGAEKVNVRSGAGVQNGIVGSLKEGSAVTVYEETSVNGAPWGRIGDDRWVAMMYVTVKQPAQGNAAENANANRGSSAVVSSTVSLNVRSGPGTGYSKVTSLVPGTSVVILQTRNVDGVAWGQIDQGWINLNYVTMIASSTISGSSYGVTGTVVNCSTGVNIRSAAGTTNALVGVARLNSKVTVTEIKKVNGFDWGRIDKGWVCMDYVRLDEEFKSPDTKVEADIVVNDLMTVFDGYPASISNSAGGVVLEDASATAKKLMTLAYGEDIKIRGFKVAGGVKYAKVIIGSVTGWVNMSDITMVDVNVRVTASPANTYEAPSTRSTFFAALVKGTQLEIKLSDANSWTLADGIFWGKISSTSVGHNAWINMSDVTMFLGNEARTGITTVSGVGYLTGSLNADTVVYLDSNGNVSTTTPSSYTLKAGQRVNILARNLTGTTTYGKVSVGSVVGWIVMDNVDLDPVQMKATAANRYYSVSADAAAINGLSSDGTLEVGQVFTITDRELVSSTNEINSGLIDVGTIYIGDDMTKTAKVVLDEGKMVPLTAATQNDNSNPFVTASVIVPGYAISDLTIREEAVLGSKQLLVVSKNSPVTILNWNIVDGVAWGKVQVNKIVGWVRIEKVGFNGLSGVVKNGSMSLYNNADKASSVQILRTNNLSIPVAEVLFDGRTVWGKVTIGDKTGWADLAEMTLNAASANYQPTTVIATGRINSVNTTVNASGSIISLPKGTEVKLTKVKVVDATTTWTVSYGDKSGDLDMTAIDMNSAVATVITPSIPVYVDFTSATSDTNKIGELYRGESTTVRKFLAQNGKLYGEIIYNNDTAWILLCTTTGSGTDYSTVMNVGLVPGATDNNAGNTPTAPSETTPVAEPTPAYIVCASFVNVRSGAGVEFSQVDSLPNGKVVKIYEKTISAQGKEWARIDEGWVCMDYVKLGTTTGATGNGGTAGAPSSPIIVTTVPAGAIAVGYASRDLDVYGGAGFGYGKAGNIAKNTSMVIYENVLSGGVSWGRTDAGWVIISYVVMTGIGQNGGTMGTIGRCGFTANVRNSANGLELTKVMINSRVAVLETSGGWARTALGWISTDYVVMDTETAPLPQDPTAPGAPVESTPSDDFAIEVG